MENTSWAPKSLEEIFGQDRSSEGGAGVLNNLGIAAGRIGFANDNLNDTGPVSNRSAVRVSTNDASPSVASMSRQLNVAIDILSQIRTISENQYNLIKGSIESNNTSNRENQLESERGRRGSPDAVNITGTGPAANTSQGIAPLLTAGFAGIAAAIAGLSTGLSNLNPFGGANAGGNATGAGVGGNAASRQAMSWFMSSAGGGYSLSAAAGIVGNLQTESGNFDPNVISGRRRGDNGTAVGIAQWHADRAANFRRVIGRPLEGSSLQDQLRFISWELANSYGGAGRALRDGNLTAGQAAAIVDQQYERSAGTARQQRINNATSLAAEHTTESMVAAGRITPSNPATSSNVGVHTRGGTVSGNVRGGAGSSGRMGLLPSLGFALPAAAAGASIGSGVVASAGAAAANDNAIAAELRMIAANDNVAIQRTAQSLSSRGLTVQSVLRSVGANSIQDVAARFGIAAAIVLTAMEAINVHNRLSRLSTTQSREAWKRQARPIIAECIRSVGINLAGIVVGAAAGAIATSETGPGAIAGAIVGALMGLATSVWLSFTTPHSDNAYGLEERAAAFYYDRRHARVATPSTTPVRPVAPPASTPPGHGEEHNGHNNLRALTEPLNGSNPNAHSSTAPHAQISPQTGPATTPPPGTSPSGIPVPALGLPGIPALGFNPFRDRAGRPYARVTEGRISPTPGLQYNLNEGALGEPIDQAAIMRENNLRDRQMQLLLQDQNRGDSSGKGDTVIINNNKTPTVLPSHGHSVGVNAVPNPSAISLMREYQLYFTSSSAMMA